MCLHCSSSAPSSTPQHSSTHRAIPAATRLVPSSTRTMPLGLGMNAHLQDLGFFFRNYTRQPIPGLNAPGELRANLNLCCYFVLHPSSIRISWKTHLDGGLHGCNRPACGKGSLGLRLSALVGMEHSASTRIYTGILLFWMLDSMKLAQDEEKQRGSSAEQLKRRQR